MPKNYHTNAVAKAFSYDANVRSRSHAYTRTRASACMCECMFVPCEPARREQTYMVIAVAAIKRERKMHWCINTIIGECDSNEVKTEMGNIRARECQTNTKLIANV